MLEAMACGAMVIAPNTGGPSEMVQDSVTGRRVSMLEPGALAATLIDLADRPTERTEVGRRAAQYVRRDASLETMARRFISLYSLARDVRGSRDGRSAV
jgi:glycosyltransferase involved in cell wall biosynthesis